jgi:hypothetical protein
MSGAFGQDDGAGMRLVRALLLLLHLLMLNTPAASSVRFLLAERANTVADSSRSRSRSCSRSRSRSRSSSRRRRLVGSFRLDLLKPAAAA